MEVNPVFVLEGKAPELKYDTITARNALQFKGAKPKTDSVKTGKDRSRFNHVLKRCEEMLGYMGISCIKGKGEAESLCAYLNDEGVNFHTIKYYLLKCLDKLQMYFFSWLMVVFHKTLIVSLMGLKLCTEISP